MRAAKQSVSWKHAASSKEEITQGSVNYLGYLMDGTRFIKNSGRKGEHLYGLLYTWMNENTSIDSFFFHYNSFCFSFLSAFLSSKPFWNN